MIEETVTIIYETVEIAVIDEGTEIVVIQNETVEVVDVAVQGEQGIQGVTGAKGDTGNAGATGQTGSQGLQGIQGETGLTGQAGAAGLQGVKGDIGNTGLTGLKGDTGETGIQGVAGTAGATGAKGDIGNTGATGLQGEQGVAGANGIQGATGLSAYQIAVNNGFTGTEAEWLASLVGGGASSYDTDAVAFFTAAAITDATQKSAANQLVLDLKASGLWLKMKAIYPFVGGTAAQHKWNLKDPRDLDAAFRLVFYGTWVHSVTGAKPDGSTAHAQTFFNPSTQIAANAGSLGYYSRTNDNVTICEIGAFDGTAGYFLVLDTPSPFFYAGANNTTFPPITMGGSAAFFQAVRTGATTIFAQINAAQTALTASYGAPNLPVYLAARNDNGNPNLRSAHECAFAYMGGSLTTIEASALYTAVQQFQTSLNRANAA